VSANNVPLPVAAKATAHKRYREPEEPRAHVDASTSNNGIAGIRRARRSQVVLQQPSYVVPAGATTPQVLDEVSQPDASSSAATFASGGPALEPMPHAWDQLFAFNEPDHDASSRAAPADGAFDAGTVGPVPPPAPIDAGEQLAAWLAVANPEDVVEMISGTGVFAHASCSSGLDALDAYGASMDSDPLIAHPSADGAGLDPLAMWMQPPEDFA
jgi:hypothetical protein